MASPAPEKTPAKFEEKFSKKPLFVNEKGQRFFVQGKENEKSGENEVKKFLKKHPSLFRFLRFLISPSLKFFSYSAGDFIKEFERSSLILNVGAGNSKISSEIVNIDITPLENIHIISFAHQMPFKDGTIDGIIAEVLLEHVDNIEEVVKEFHRVLKPAGKVYITAPFLYPFHAVPGDYHRWTKSGLQLLFLDFKTKKIEVYAGPMATLVLSTAYFLALPFSIVSKTLYEYAAYFFLIIMFPLKFLDPLFRKFPGAHYSASVFAAVFEK